MPTSDRILREVRRYAAGGRPDHDYSDRTLVDRFAQSRDERAFAELVRRHGPMVLGVCRRVLRHAADADDAFQATFLILIRRAAVIRDPDRLGPWLFGVAWRTANKLRTVRRPGFPLPDDVAGPDAAPADWPVELDAAIARLPEKYRTPVVLCHLQGLSAAEAAQRLGCPAATITTRLFRARSTLRRRLAAAGLAVPVALTAESVLHVPSALAAAAHAMAAGRSISPAAGRLADGVFRSLLMTKIRCAAVAAAACLAGVGAFGFRAGGQEPAAGPTPPPAAPAVVAAPPVVVDGGQPVTVKTANFRVTAPSQRIARLVADAAERARKDTATAWLGKEQPTRPEPCPVTVSINASGTGGATTFNFDGGKVTAKMEVEGPLDRLLADVIPHEVTHVVLADHFRKPIPRWADEGIAVLGESDEEQARHTRFFLEVLNAGRGLQVKALLARRDFPSDVAAFFAESYWLTKVLVDRKDRATLLRFVEAGIKDGWEPAAKAHYGAGLDELERDMIDKLKAERKATPSAVVDRASKTAPVFALATADAEGRITVFQRTNTHYEPVTSYMRRDVRVEGSPVPKSYVEPVTNYRLQTAAVAPRMFARGTVRAITPDGTPVDDDKLVATLKGKTVAVVLAPNGDGVDKAFANLLKSDTLILVVPVDNAAPPPPVIPPTEK